MGVAVKQRIFGWISVLIGVVLALATVEVAAIAWLYVEDGRYTPAAELFALVAAQRRSSLCLHDTHRVARGKACRRALPIGLPQDSQIP